MELNFDIVTKLAACSTIITGTNIDKKKLNKEQIGTPYIVGASNIQDGQLIFDTYVDESLLKNPAISHKGDIIISVVGTLGKMGINTVGRIVLSKHVAAIRLKKGVSKHYAMAMIMRLMLEIIPNKEEGRLGFQQKIDMEALKDIEFVLPSLILQEYAVAQMTSIASIILSLHTKKDDLLSFGEMIKIISEQRKTYRKNFINISDCLEKINDMLPDTCMDLKKEITEEQIKLSKIV